MSQSYEMTGKVVKIEETKAFASGFTKREFLVEETDGKYPQTLKFEAHKHLCDALDAYKEGDEITLSFNLKGNEYNGKHYVQLQAWKFDRAGERRSANQNGAPPPKKQEAPKNAAPADDFQEEDDIPF